MLTEKQKELIVQSWRLVVPIAETAADLFYKRLFEENPQYRALFPEDMSRQKRKLMTTLKFVVHALDWASQDWDEQVDPEEDLFLVVLALGRRHGELYKIPDESYPAVGAALLWTLDYGLGDAFTPEVKEAWSTVYSILSTTMLMGTKAKPAISA